MPILRGSAKVLNYRAIAIDIGIGGIKGIHVLERPDKLGIDFPHSLHVKPGGHPGRTDFQKIPAHRVGSLIVHDLDGIDAVAFGFAHLLAVLIQNQIVDQTAFIA